MIDRWRQLPPDEQVLVGLFVVLTALSLVKVGLLLYLAGRSA